MARITKRNILTVFLTSIGCIFVLTRLRLLTSECPNCSMSFSESSLTRVSKFSLQSLEKTPPNILSAFSPKRNTNLDSYVEKRSNFPRCSTLENFTKPYFRRIEGEVPCLNKSFFKLYDSKVTDVPMDFSIPGAQICDTKISILFVGPSVVDTETNKARLEIRKTWASKFYGSNWLQASSMKMVFFFGSSGLNDSSLTLLQKESAIFGDIVVGNFNDTYGNLSLKMTVIISWVAKYCPNVEAVVKVDMDTFVNVDLLSALLHELPRKTHPMYVFGKQHKAIIPPVVRTGVWTVPENLYPFAFFPKYIYGHSYVISGPAVNLLASSFPYFPIIPNEDAFVTGIMAMVLNITQFDSPFADKKAFNTVEEFKHNRIVSIILENGEREEVWDQMKTKICFES
ncbi:hypothetical protein RRG08_018612 [Elysia crispata]|uniref:Hexosyltransferase n=1 Tax=Elysia crispata TaxID=231223 RepID=A0AAE1B3L9_9GAST|nr:hypothetical protein RRG08_018612 [Elysia crispata]